MMQRRNKNPAVRVGELVLADIPERNRLRELRLTINTRRDDIAALDFEIEALRLALSDFEARYHERLVVQHEALRRIEGFVRHVERMSDALRDAMIAESRGRVVDLGAKVRRIEEKRRREIEQRLQTQAARVEASGKPSAAAQDASVEPNADSKSRLKTAYRALARRFHPDLARTEDERVRFGVTMSRVNELYRSGDLGRLEMLAEQAKGGEIEDDELSLDEQLAALEQRLRWFDTVHKNLLDERRALERSKTCELMRNVEQAVEVGRDLLGELQVELTERALRAENDVRSVIELLESKVDAYNRKAAGGDRVLAIEPLDATVALEKRFDPFADKALIRFGLEELATLRLGREAEQCADWVGQLADSHEPLLHAILLAYVADLSPYPLPGLERFSDVQLRFDALEDERIATSASEDEERWTFERTLVAADDVLEYGPKQMSERVVRAGLRLRSAAMRDGILLALREHKLRTVFKRVLAVIGERKSCATCAEDVFTVPLYRLRGLDALRALVCPQCGGTLHSYWMPKGEDVQAVLNGAFIDFEMVSEWSFRLASSSVATQLARVELEETTIADLKRRLHNDVFKRNGIEIALGDISLEQEGKRVGERRRADELASRSLQVRFAPEAGLNEADTLEVLKHRIRSRFSSDG